MSKHNAMVLCEHKKVACTICIEIIKKIKSLLADIDTSHGKLSKISELLGVKYYG